MTSAIADYALIGDGHTAALVHRHGSIDWLCWPRFDSEACCARLLGGDGNGHWAIMPADAFYAERRYRPETLILETTFTNGQGRSVLCDHMRNDGEGRQVLVRILTCLHGAQNFHNRWRLSFGNGAAPARLERGGDRVFAQGGDRPLALSASRQGALGLPDAEFVLKKGDQVAFVMGEATARIDDALAFARASERQVERFWHDWVLHCSYEGPWREQVLRSLITLKALIFAPTGPMVAAPTSSLPEHPGGTHNWDYRFCWLRDSTFALLAMMHAGYEDEARQWIAWLLHELRPSERLQPLYGIDGRRALDESEAPWLSGHAGSRPVRFGNAAFAQHQLGVYGEVQDSLHQWRRRHTLPDAAWHLQQSIAKQIAALWREPDSGIWEERRRPECFTLSRVLAWVGIDRAIRSARRLGIDAPCREWETLRARLRNEVCDRGYDPHLNAFTRSFGSRSFDAGLLLLPIMGFLPAGDPRVRGTLEGIQRHLGDGAFVYRYDPSFGSDGVGGPEGTFLPCAFWLMDNLILAGDPDRAAQSFETVLGACNDVGLLSEEFDPSSRRLLGNFPQALSHLSLVHTAFNLTGNGPLDIRSGTVDW